MASTEQIKHETVHQRRAYPCQKCGKYYCMGGEHDKPASWLQLGELRQHCSAECYLADRPTYTLVPARKCDVCSEKFVGKNARQRICNKQECRDQRYQSYRRRKKKEFITALNALDQIIETMEQEIQELKASQDISEVVKDWLLAVMEDKKKSILEEIEKAYEGQS